MITKLIAISLAGLPVMMTGIQLCMWLNGADWPTALFLPPFVLSVVVSVIGAAMIVLGIVFAVLESLWRD